MFASGLPEPAEEPPRRRRSVPWGTISLVLIIGLALVQHGTGKSEAGPPQPAAAAVTDNRAPETSARTSPRALPFSPAERVRIPMIRVDAPVVPVGLDANGWVGAPPPENPNLAAWFTGAVSPGEKGTAVVVGHVDNAAGPAVFYAVGALRNGNRVEVRREDGKMAVFKVYGVELYPKNHFPGHRVYGSKGRPELRIITCGGAFSRESGYAGNVVAYARLSEVHAAVHTEVH